MLHTKYQSSRPSTFWEEEFRNLSSLFLCSNLWPHSRTSPDPRGIVWTDLVEVHKEMLNTKYQGSRPSSFRVEELWNFRSLFLWSTNDPQGGASFYPRGILWTNLVEVNREMPHTKYKISTPSSFREITIEDVLLCSFVPTCDPRGGASFDTRGVIWTTW